MAKKRTRVAPAPQSVASVTPVVNPAPNVAPVSRSLPVNQWYDKAWSFVKRHPRTSVISTLVSCLVFGLSLGSVIPSRRDFDYAGVIDGRAIKYAEFGNGASVMKLTVDDVTYSYSDLENATKINAYEIKEPTFNDKLEQITIESKGFRDTYTPAEINDTTLTGKRAKD